MSRQFVRPDVSYLSGIAFGLVVTLHFINHNYDQTFPAERLEVLIAGFVITSLFYGFLYLFQRDRGTAVLTAVFSLLFFNFDGLYRIYPNPLGFAIIVAVIVLGLGYVLRRISERTRNAVENMMTTAAMALLVMHGYLFAGHVRNNEGVEVSADNADMVAAESMAKAKVKPDIYYIMPDDYVGNVSLAETYHFDNRVITDDLRVLGYYVPAQSFSNYPVTTTSLASSFNGGLLKATGDVAHATARAPIYELIREPEVARFLQRMGYTFVQMGSYWNPTQTSNYADVDLQYAYGAVLFGQPFHVSEFLGVFLGRSMLQPLFDRGILIGRHQVLAWQGGDPAKTFLKQVDDLEELSDDEGPPKFVFAHLLMPHLPIVFDADGKPIPHGIPENEGYVRQLQFTNSKLTEIARTIEASERGRTAIVVIASDEGQFPANDTITGTDAQLRHKSNTFSAIYFPDHDYTDVHPTVTPVNYFRIIFNKYFGTHLTLNPDSVYAFRTSKNYPLDLADVTNRVRP